MARWSMRRWCAAPTGCWHCLRRAEPTCARPGDAQRRRRRSSMTSSAGRRSPRPVSRSPRAMLRCTRRSSATACASRSTPTSTEAVSGTAGLLAHPMLVCDIAIGQSTAAEHARPGNLFYRGLGAPAGPGRRRRCTRRTEVVARRRRRRAGAASSRCGCARSTARATPVLDFHARALLPASARRADRRSRRRLDGVGDLGSTSRDWSAAGWDLDAAACRAAGTAVRRAAGRGRGRRRGGRDGDRRDRAGAAVAQHRAHAHRCGRERARPAPGLRRARHRRRRRACRRARCRTWPRSSAWESCDHLGPTFEGDRCASRVELTACEPLPDGGLVHLRVADDRARAMATRRARCARLAPRGADAMSAGSSTG